MSQERRRIEREILKLVDQTDKLDTRTMAALIFGYEKSLQPDDVTEDQMATVRRAVAALARKRLIFRVGREHARADRKATSMQFVSRNTAIEIAQRLVEKGQTGDLLLAPEFKALLADHNDPH